MHETEMHETTWGKGEPALLVHGSVSTGEEDWAPQRPLAEEGFLLRVIDRRGYGASPRAEGEDFRADAEDIAELLADGVHLVGLSYGGVGALLAAAARPSAVRSLAVIEPPAFALPDDDSAAREMIGDMERVWAESEGAGDREFLVEFLQVVGIDPAQIPDEMLDAWAEDGVAQLRNCRRPWEAEVPTDDLAAAPFPKVVFSGGHSPAFDAVCGTLADRIGARREVIEGAGHNVQMTGEPFNQALLALWRSANSGR